MRLHTYRDESRSRHFDLIFGGERPRSIDLVSAAALSGLFRRRAKIVAVCS